MLFGRKNRFVQSIAERDEQEGGAPSVGTYLIRELRARYLSTSLVFYHESADERQRNIRRELPIREGAFGEAIMLDELLGLVSSTLGLQ